MRKVFKITLSSIMFLLMIGSVSMILDTKSANAASTGSVSLEGTILQYLSLEITSGGTIGFGNITPGTPKCDTNGTVIDVTTNAANGYTIGLSDSGTTTNSSMTHTDTTTKIADMSGTIAAPASWVNGTTKGIGVSLFAGTNKNTTQWGSGATACAVGNKWAGVPENTTTAHTVTGYHAAADTSSWGWQVDVPNTQKTGTYSGSVLFTSTAVLS